MKLLELQEIFHFSENVKIIYRDPSNQLEYVKLYEGIFKALKEKRLLERKVIILVTDEVTKEIYIEIE